MKRLMIQAVAAFCLALPLSAGAARADDDADARVLITRLVEDARGAFGGQILEPAERVARLKGLIERYGDMGVFADEVLGRYWNRASQSDRTIFLQLLPQYLSGCWSSETQGVPASLRVDLAGSERDGDALVVHSLATVPDDTIALDWRVVRAADGHPVIADVAVDGGSVLLTIRSDFQSFLRGNSGHFDALLTALQMKLAAVRKDG